MRHFVSDDVVRETREDRLPRQVRPRIVFIGRKVAEQDRIQLVIEVGVTRLERVWKEAQTVAAEKPKPPAERAIEVLEDLRCDGIDHLLMELRVVLERLETLRHRDLPIVEVHRAKVALGGGVVIDDLETIVAERALLRNDVLVGNLDRDPVVAGARDHRIEREDSERAALGAGIEWRLAHRGHLLVGRLFAQDDTRLLRTRLSES